MSLMHRGFLGAAFWQTVQVSAQAPGSCRGKRLGEACEVDAGRLAVAAQRQGVCASLQAPQGGPELVCLACGSYASMDFADRLGGELGQLGTWGVLAVGATMGSVVTCGLLTVAWHLRGLLETPFEELSMEADDLVEEYNMQKQRRSLPARPAADVELGQLLGKSSKAVRRETCSRTSSGARRSGSEVREAGPGRRKPAAEAPTGPSSMLAQTRSATAGRGRGRAMAAPSRDSKWLLLEAALDRDQHTEDDGLGARAMPVSIGKVERFQGAAPSATTAAPPPTRCPPRPAR